MTREKALNILHNASVYHPNYLDALNIAIKTLEQEPCEDAVSREAFITRYKEWMRSERGKIPNDDTLAIRVIESLPSVTPKPKTGHWIMTGDYYTGAYGSIDYVECSCCHEYSLEEGSYCPNCGAKMESEE